MIKQAYFITGMEDEGYDEGRCFGRLEGEGGEDGAGLVMVMGEMEGVGRRKGGGGEKWVVVRYLVGTFERVQEGVVGE